MRQSVLIVFSISLITVINAACIYKQPSSCGKYDVISGVVTCPNSCPNLCSCTGTSPLCSCGVPQCSCFKDTEKVCNACKPEPSPICSCLAELDLGCDCSTKKSFIYYPDVQYPLTVLEMNPFFFSTCFSS